MTAEESMVRYYAERAREYDRIYSKPERQADLQTLRRLVACTFAGAHVLELACGTGYWTQVLTHSAASVVATDINEEVLAIARSRLARSPTLVFRRVDAYALSTVAERVDAGLAAFWWSHIPQDRLRSFLAEFHRLLPPGARVMFLDNTYVEGSSTPLSRTDERGNTYQMRSLDDGSRHEVLKNFPTAAELRAAVEDHATDVEVQFLDYYWMLRYRLSRFVSPS